MRCQIRVPLGKTGFIETYCYETLDDKGNCSIHGQQASQKPDWMSDEQFKTALSHVQGQTVVIGHRPKRACNSDTSDGGTQSGNSGIK